MDFSRYVASIQARDNSINAVKWVTKSFKRFRIAPVSVKNLGLNHSSLLEKHVGYILPCSLVIYITLQILMGVNYNSDNPICNANITLSPWAETSLSSAAACMILNFILHTFKIIGLLQAKKINYSLIKLIMMLAMISFISGSSLVLSFNWQYGGICRDSLGVYSNAAQWSEWIVLVPMLQYIALSAEQKDHLERFDIIMIAIMVLIISFSFLLILNISFGVAVFLFISATLGLMIITCMTFNNYISARNQSKSVIIRTSNFFKERQKQRRAILLCTLTVIQWYYPTIYILAVAKVLDHNYTIACFALGSMFGKVLLSTLEVETHISMLYEFLLTSPNSNLGETSSSRVPTARTQDETSFTMREFSNKYLTSIGSFNSILKPLSIKYSKPNLFLGTAAKVHVEAHQLFDEEGEKEQDNDSDGDNDEDFIVIDEDGDLIPEVTQHVDGLTRSEIVVLV